MVILNSGRLAVELAPQSGGSVARFTCDGVDILRPMTAEAIASGKGMNAALYPLVPYSNRIRDGRLSFGDEIIRLARNWPGLDHPMHGDGWAHAWRVVRSDAESAEIVYEHERAGEQGGWPFRYRARQQYRLRDGGFSIRISIENLEDRVVPAGVGLHPFFVRQPDCTLTCRTAFVWRTDTEVLPTECIPVPPEWDFSRGRRPDTVLLDNCFDGWDGRASIAWPSRRLRLDLEASEPFRHLVIYTPAGQRFFCAEPVSHANGQVGLAPLVAGGTLAGEAVFRLSTL
ncbi:MAG: aldose 1-epimerase [Proteobacteria bacterium]|nr:aldose 1-epimerase [Pseudomonadota bacterium]